MKRDTFIVAVITAAAMPIRAFSAIPSFWQSLKHFKIRAGEGRIHGHLTLKGVNFNVLDVKVSGSDTAGDLAIFEQTSKSPGRGTPLHVHLSQDEYFHVRDGHYIFVVGEDHYDLVKGDSIFLPRQTPHAWKQISKSGMMTVVVQPAGKLENFFVTIAALDHEPSQAEIEDIFAANEMKVVGPPIKS
jgi:quercetin dioxygenase-like cupin family protein